MKEKTFIGLDILRRFLDGGHSEAAKEVAHLASQPTKKPASSLAKRVIACLDVRSNDAGDLVVTKGDQYDVREQTSDREVQTHTLIVSCRNFRRCVCY
jgi:glutamine amidotransferase/cyclase